MPLTERGDVEPAETITRGQNLTVIPTHRHTHRLAKPLVTTPATYPLSL
jgi:hypothetical protein